MGADQPPQNSLSPSPLRVSTVSSEGTAASVAPEDPAPSTDLLGARLTTSRPAGSCFLPLHPEMPCRGPGGRNPLLTPDARSEQQD